MLYLFVKILPVSFALLLMAWVACLQRRHEWRRFTFLQSTLSVPSCMCSLAPLYDALLHRSYCNANGGVWQLAQINEELAKGEFKMIITRKMHAAQQRYQLIFEFWSSVTNDLTMDKAFGGYQLSEQFTGTNIILVLRLGFDWWSLVRLNMIEESIPCLWHHLPGSQLLANRLPEFCIVYFGRCSQFAGRPEPATYFAADVYLGIDLIPFFLAVLPLFRNLQSKMTKSGLEEAAHSLAYRDLYQMC